MCSFSLKVIIALKGLFENVYLFKQSAVTAHAPGFWTVALVMWTWRYCVCVNMPRYD